MTSRRAFLADAAGAVAGLGFVGCGLLTVHPAQAQTSRRQVTVGSRRVKTVDVHAHAAVPEAMALMSLRIAPPSWPPQLLMDTPPERLAAMDAQGIDVQALSINPFWYKADRDLATRICQIQNAGLAQICAATPDRFVAFATVALQHPDLAAAQLEDGVKKYNLRGAAIGGSVNGEEISDPKFHRSGPRPRSSGCWCSSTRRAPRS
jgi:predicted TIM-barrel fold metal-dependent hydrolase